MPLEGSMLRITSAAFVLFTALVISIGVLPSSSAEANGTRYLRGGAVYRPPAVFVWQGTGGVRYAFRGDAGYYAGPYVNYIYPVYWGHPREYDELRVIVVAPGPYYINGCCP
jgi:hypothetical protein